MRQNIYQSIYYLNDVISRDDANSMVFENYTNLKYLRFTDPNDIIIRAAIKRESKALVFVKEQTDYLIKYAIKCEDFKINFIRELTNEKIMWCLMHNPNHISDVVSPTYEMCEFVIKISPATLQYIPLRFQTDELCMLALTKMLWTHIYLKNPSFNIILYLFNNGVQRTYISSTVNCNTEQLEYLQLLGVLLQYEDI